ncbi:MAG: Maf-like protein [Deltaproteobacteria bacterium]|nr:Maf-like protein [Deltaproteobacteria bacterium]
MTAPSTSSTSSTARSSLVLASGSAIRKRLLQDAGVAFVADPADLDEDGLVHGVADPAAQARLLAVAKARHVARRHPGAFVLGGDQVGVLDDGTPLVKPRDPEHHVATLAALSGRRHTFHPAVALVKDDVVLAEGAAVVTVTMRPFSAACARAYVATGEGRGSCGGYESEHRAAQLIDDVAGDLQAVLGFPLRLVLPMLRAHCPGAAGLLPD